MCRQQEEDKEEEEGVKKKKKKHPQNRVHSVGNSAGKAFIPARRGKQWELLN